MHTYTADADARSHLPEPPEGRAVYEALCSLLGAPAEVVDALAFYVRCLPAPCNNLRVEIGVLAIEAATFDAEGVVRRSSVRAYAGGTDALPCATYAPQVRVAFRAVTQNYGGARNDAERLAYTEHSATVPMLSGNVGIARAVEGLAYALECAVKRAVSVPLRNVHTVAQRNARCTEARSAARSLREVAAALRVPGADAALILREGAPAPATDAVAP